jgi:flagellar basal-body rod protein FlgF
LDNSTYVALSRQMTLRRQLDIVANNIANADTAGFKAEALTTAVEQRAPSKNAQVHHATRFVLDNGVSRNFGQGSLRQTGNELDVAIDGDAFFSVTTPEGERYTRDGRFKLDAAGQLVTQAGEPVLDDGGGPITLRRDGSAPSIAADGTVSQDGERVARLGVVRFDNLGALSKTGEGLYLADGAAPVAAPDVQLRQGMLESSNVNPVLEVVNLVEVSRAYERVTRMIDQTQDLSRRAVDRLGKAG